MTATLTDLQKKQIEQAEELLFSGPQKECFPFLNFRKSHGKWATKWWSK
jgi:hypothetical protein